MLNLIIFYLTKSYLFRKKIYLNKMAMYIWLNHILPPQEWYD